MATTSVLIVGAGPTGLNLALSLARRGVDLRIISDAAGPGEHSRAMVVQARTLEFYDQLGFADEVVAQGVKAGAAHLRQNGRDVVTVSFADLGAGLTPYPFALAYPQDDHERFLIDKLNAAGRTVEWNSRLEKFTEDENGVRAQVMRNGHAEEMRATYICGCDGAHSCVRETLSLDFPGGTYEQLFYVADVRITRGFDRDLYINLGKHVLTLMFPVRSSGMQRLIGLVPQDLSQHRELTFADLRREVEAQLDIRVADVNWFATYRVHHRVAERFRVSRAFLLGDAGHIHSPAGGQGMNTGIGDAINLAWKLAHVLARRADTSLLDTYERERIGFARSLVSTTDRAFTPIVAEGFQGEITRRLLAPLFMTAATRFALSRHALFSVISQMRIHYPDSPLSEGKAGEVHGGDRLPWIGADAQDNFAPLRSLDWQLHVYGTITPELATACREVGLPVHTFAWSEAADNGGMRRDAAYFVRPDGYVAFASSEQSVTPLKAFIDRWRLRFSGTFSSGG